MHAFTQSPCCSTCPPAATEPIALDPMLGARCSVLVLLWLRGASADVAVGAEATNFGATWLVKGDPHGGGKRHDKVTRDELAWESLPGRCCFDGEWVGPLGAKTWVQHAQTCGACSVWGTVSSTCHNSAKSCVVGCGVPLYLWRRACGQVPPFRRFW